jgi:hypothetical protein
MSDYLLPFDLSPLTELDQFAQLACERYNFGNETDWFGCFRGGIPAVHYRVQAVQRHYYDVHAWVPSPRFMGDAEYHLASLFFNMDSALECLVFGLNALGSAAYPSDFRDVTDRRALRQIAPVDLMGSEQQPALAGYERVFPRLQEDWRACSDLISFVTEHHAVSKHRSTIFRGGRSRDDPPPGFFEAIGLAGHPARFAYGPMAEIILIPDPKEPPAQHKPTPREKQVLLENLGPQYCDFLNRSVQLALVDATHNILLKHEEFLSSDRDDT